MPPRKETKKKINSNSSESVKPKKRTIKIVRKTKAILSKESTDSSKESSKSSRSSKSSSNRDPNLDKYKPPVNIIRVKPKVWELPNRKNFYNWIINTFQQYETGNVKKQKPEPRQIKEQLELSSIQRLTRDYLQGESPVRGLLLYIGLGHGKTCAAITISEAIRTKKEVIIFSKANLESNFKKEIRQCGDDYVKILNFWEFRNCKNNNEKELAEELGIPIEAIHENGGAFFADFTKTKSNYNDLETSMRSKLDNQIEHTIEKRFKFIHFDNPRLWSKLKEDEFDDKIVIIDEVHNIGNIMASDKRPNAMKYYNLFMNAKNPKYIFLSGTPIINQIYEITKIFNILRGYMNVLEITFKNAYDTNIDYSNINYILKKNKHIDQIVINKTQKLIKISKNPDNFTTQSDDKGIVYNPEDAIDFATFKQEITMTIQKLGYKISVVEKRETCFPETKLEFETEFYNPELNKLKKIDLIKRRIAGLTSYYEYPDKTKYPDLLPINKVFVPMSKYQFGSYERYRHQEIEKDKYNKKKQDDESQQQQSSYRLKSRLVCSFVFPEEIGSPYDSKVFEDKLKLGELLADSLEDFEFTTTAAEEMKTKDLDKELREGYLNLLYKERAKYLDVKNGSLAKYAPKYLAMINNIQKERGKILVYSYFRTLIGLNTFSYALIQTGKWAPFRIKKNSSKGGKATKNDTVWELDEYEDEVGKAKFMFYTGGEDKDEREIYRIIYNSEWDKLPQNCSKLVEQLKAKHANNYYGEVIKIIMTTRTGAEGLDLKEVRYIHILEPYWQPVLIDQLIGRGVRNGSHLTLVPADRNVEVFIYMATFTPELTRKITYIDVKNDIYKYSNPAIPEKAFKVVTSDEYLYMIAERKKIIISEFQKLMKETAFDCALNYNDNTLNPINKGLVCMDYPTKNRNQYLFTPSINDTIDNIDIAQEKVVKVQYGQIKYKGKIFYYNNAPDSNGKMYIYDDTMVGRIRLPKPVGEVKIVDGKKQYVFFRSNKEKKKNNKKK